MGELLPIYPEVPGSLGHFSDVPLIYVTGNTGCSGIKQWEVLFPKWVKLLKISLSRKKVHVVGVELHVVWGVYGFVGGMRCLLAFISPTNTAWTWIDDDISTCIYFLG